jgi:hypothetical protein
MNNIEALETLQSRIENKESTVYFLTYDTKNNARAAVKNIYDMALALRQNGYNAKILVEEKEYTGVEFWLGDTYKDIPVVCIKADKVEIFVDDIVVVPEYYSNVLPQLASIKAVKVMLVQQKEYIFETLSIGSKWKDFGFDKAITTTESTKKYISEYFPETLVHLIPPYIGDNFTPTEKPQKPIIAISCRDRNQQRKIISEFYLKYPQLRWITFRDMVQMNYDEFAGALKECMVSVWIDDESTFGTFPLESMKCGVPVIGKIPNNEPDWMSDNGMWTDDTNKIVSILATYVFSWLEGVELTDPIKEKMRTTVLPYTKEIHSQNTVSIFHSLFAGRIDTIKTAIEKIKTEGIE